MIIILKRLGLILATSLLLYASWPPSVFGPLVFIAFIPLLFYVDSLKSTSLKKYFQTLSGTITSIFLFAFLVSYGGWGDYNINVYIGIIAEFLPLCIVISLYGFYRNKKIGLLFLIFSWASMELFQMVWEINSPLLMLSNSLSMYPSIIQHYSYWGSIGGTMYILFLNALIFVLLKKLKNNDNSKRILIYLGIAVLPIIHSIITYSIEGTKVDKVKVAIVLGNFEHFTEEYAKNPYLTIERYNRILAEEDIDDIDLVFFPESAVINSGWIENLNNDSLTNPLDSLCLGKQIIMGSHVFSLYAGSKEDRPYFVRQDESSKLDYLTHNCVLFRSSSGYYSIRSKSKFVPFHEVSPYSDHLSFLTQWLNKLDTPSFLSEYEKSQSKPFKTKNGLNVYTIMCFESFFSNMIVKQNDANLIAVLANESWNYQKRGKEQYLSYMIPKAIESGKAILKVANGGYSAYINSKGKIIEKIGFESPYLKKLKIDLDDSHSIYSGFHIQIHFIINLITFILFIYLILNRKP